ncbi:MAG: hypothetical protein JXB32_11040, partial [Deltaproteobacteria bacterium]|nr:hypothetical protein [Deltaproteobacteria bacterium]
MMIRALRHRFARATWSTAMALALGGFACGDDDSAADVPTDTGADHVGDVAPDAGDDGAVPDGEPEASEDFGPETEDTNDSADVPDGCPRPGDP